MKIGKLRFKLLDCDAKNIFACVVKFQVFTIQQNKFFKMTGIQIFFSFFFSFSVQSPTCCSLEGEKKTEGRFVISYFLFF